MVDDLRIKGWPPCKHGRRKRRCKDCKQEYHRLYGRQRRSDPRKRFESLMTNKCWKEVKKSFTYEQYMKMLETQNGVCAICQQPETAMRNGKAKRLAIDHDHNTHVVRGLLCTLCNRNLGRYETAFDDSKNQHWIKYLGKRPK